MRLCLKIPEMDYNVLQPNPLISRLSKSKSMKWKWIKTILLSFSNILQYRVVSNGDGLSKLYYIYISNGEVLWRHKELTGYKQWKDKQTYVTHPWF